MVASPTYLPQPSVLWLSVSEVQSEVFLDQTPALREGLCDDVTMCVCVCGGARERGREYSRMQKEGGK